MSDNAEEKAQQALELYRRMVMRMEGKASEIEVRRFVGMLLAALEEIDRMRRSERP